MEIPLIDVEKHFNNFLEENGVEVSDKILTGANKPVNPDYIFHQQKVIAELKTLKQDPFKNKDFLKSLKKKQNEWLDKGYITQVELSQIKTLDQLPDRCYRDAKNLFFRSIKNKITKANDQIKSMKKRLNLLDYKGLLFLCSDGNYYYQPYQIIRILEELISDGKYFTSINTVLYYTVNMVTKQPGDQFQSRLWMPLYRPGFEDVSRQYFGVDLYNKWVDYFNKVTGMDVVRLSLLNEAGIDPTNSIQVARFVKPLSEK